MRCDRCDRVFAPEVGESTCATCRISSGSSERPEPPAIPAEPQPKARWLHLVWPWRALLDGKPAALSLAITHALGTAFPGGVIAVAWHRFLRPPRATDPTWAVLSPGWLEHLGLPVFLLLPFLVLGWMFGLGAVVHFLLVSLGDGRQRYRTTVVVIGHAIGSAGLFLWLPIVGPSGFLAWGFVASVVGLREMQGTRTWKAIVALLLPPFVCGSAAAGGLFLAFRMSAAR